MSRDTIDLLQGVELPEIQEDEEEMKNKSDDEDGQLFDEVADEAAPQDEPAPETGVAETSQDISRSGSGSSSKGSGSSDSRTSGDSNPPRNHVDRSRTPPRNRRDPSRSPPRNRNRNRSRSRSPMRNRGPIAAPQVPCASCAALMRLLDTAVTANAQRAAQPLAPIHVNMLPAPIPVPVRAPIPVPVRAPIPARVRLPVRATFRVPAMAQIPANHGPMVNASNQNAAWYRRNQNASVSHGGGGGGGYNSGGNNNSGGYNNNCGGNNNGGGYNDGGGYNSRHLNRR